MNTCQFAFVPYIVECSFNGVCVHQAGGGSMGGHCEAPDGIQGPVAPKGITAHQGGFGTCPACGAREEKCDISCTPAKEGG